MFLAYRGNETVGRIMGLINNRYNKIHSENHGRFCFMECFNDQEVFHALITKVEEWAKNKGMSKMVGPLGFSDKDPQGFQIEGFDYPRLFTAPTNSHYLSELIEKEGYVKNRDLVNYICPMPSQLPEVYKRVLSRMTGTDGYKIIEFTSKKELKPFIIPVLEVMNQTFMEIYGFVPLTDKEKKDFAARYLPILDPSFIKVVEYNGELIAFAIGMPDPSKGILKARGRMFPFGFIKILSEIKKSKTLLMLLGGIKKEFRGQGLDVLMGVKIIESGIKNKMEWIDSHLVLEDNKRMRAEYERVNGKVLRKFRIYRKDL
jgi:hypothetical protein